jgi:RNA polymerase sigma factor (sigma-70 family)
MEKDLENIVEKYGLMISRISHRMIKNNELAKEAVQEVWYEVFKSIDSFRGDSELSTWIYTIARRTILKYSKNEIVLSQIEIEQFRDLPLVDYYGAEEDKKDWIKEKCDTCITAFCHCLTNDARMIFLFRENAGLSYGEISKIMEMKEDNVRQISIRSLHKVRTFLKETCPLYCPDGTCKCRIRHHVVSINFEKEYEKVKKVVRLVHFFKKFDKDLPRKNYWENLIN